jgi:hypothetical protein
MNKLEKGLIILGTISSLTFSTLSIKDIAKKDFKNFNRNFYGLLGSSALILGGSSRSIYKEFIKDYKSIENKPNLKYKNE